MITEVLKYTPLPLTNYQSLKLTIMDKRFEKIYEIQECERQYVFEVFECDTWLSTSSMEHKATCNSLEEAVNLIMEHGEFYECDDKDYIRDFLMEYMQTPTGCVKYIISGVEVGAWNE